ncbi:uncharacterized protein LOC130124497 [Lampris incognitus]|uniref:uncharacterized protein LOC130120005 n=1 Tax=Lampris incognitus TaxID=2546036 RepID=UPI0024B5E0B8|nr:uncharacterized protein LOC130120005 [Lampris incognitus]XP_056149914.1 uncharacterized protein LOC130124497 [Lampris incognitus]
MPHCCVPLCLNRSESKTETKLSFYRFPPKDKDKKRWLQLIRRDGFTPSPCSRVCSWHFPNGKAAGPSRFAWNEGKTFPGHLSLPHKKRKTVPLPPSGEEGTNELELQNSDIATAEPPSTSDNPTAETPSTSDNPTADTPSTSDNPTADTPNTSDNPTADTPGTSDNPTADTPSTSDNPTADTPRTSDNPFNSVALLEIEVDMLRRENEKLKRELEKQKQTFSFSQISSNRVKVKYFTGLPDVATVLVLEALLSKFELQYHSNWTVQSMPLVDQLLLTLMKLKLNSGHEDLATRFNCSTATVTNIFITIVSALYDILYVGMLENNIPSIEKNQASLPECFRPFPNCRIVLDCTELAVSRTERLDKQNHLWSQYKKRTTQHTKP